MKNEVNYLVGCITKLQTDIMESDKMTEVLDIVERRENLIQSLMRLVKKKTKDNNK